MFEDNDTLLDSLNSGSSAATKTVVQKESSKGLGIAALIVAIIAAALAGGALTRSRRTS